MVKTGFSTERAVQLVYNYRSVLLLQQTRNNYYSTAAAIAIDIVCRLASGTLFSVLYRCTECDKAWSPWIKFGAVLPISVDRCISE
jgi:hypothetical protein